MVVYVFIQTMQDLLGNIIFAIPLCSSAENSNDKKTKTLSFMKTTPVENTFKQP